MKPKKFKVTETSSGVPYTIREKGNFTIQAIYYSSSDPSKFLHLSDKDGDPVFYPVPGGIDPKIVLVDPITVEFPITVIDEDGGNTVILRGIIE